MSQPTIHSTQGQLIHRIDFADQQYMFRIKVPDIAKEAKPGQFVHIQCNPFLPMRRPMSIMRCNTAEGWIEIMFRSTGQGTRLLAQMKINQEFPIMGPAGGSFKLKNYRPRPLLIGGGIGIPPIFFLALHLSKIRNPPGQGQPKPLVLAGSESPFPFGVEPSRLVLPDLPAEVTGAVAMLEGRGIASRLACGSPRAGCYHGHITQLAEKWLQSMDDAAIQETEIFACGPEPMLKATAELASTYGIPAELSVEEFMACATGGCAGCAIPVHTANGTEMQRVCVEGPVFSSEQLYP